MTTSESHGVQAGLSVAERYRRYHAEHPQAFTAEALAPFYARVRQVMPSVCGAAEPYPLLPWPVWVEESLVRELEAASVRLSRLFRSLPRRLFASDPKRIAAFLGMESEMMAAMLLAEPNFLDQTFCRGDFLLTREGPRLLEFNIGNVGGWQTSSLGPLLAERPDVADFLRREGLTAACRDSLRNMLDHVVGHFLTTALGAEPVHLLIVVSDEGGTSTVSHPEAVYQRHFAEVLRQRAPGRAGRLRVARVRELTFPRGEVHVDGVRYFAVVEQNDTRPSRDVFRAFKAGLVACYTSPIGMILGDKRLVAALSNHGASDAFTPEERGLIDRYVPWTRQVRGEVTSFRGQDAPMADVLERHRSSLVLKAGQGYGGTQVHVGRVTEPAAWGELARLALEQGDWVVQEYLETDTPVFQNSDLAATACNVVWGLYTFGDTYGGVFIRMAPTAAGAVVNITHGARVALALEVRPA